MLRFRRWMGPLAVVLFSWASVASLDEEAPLVDRATEGDARTLELVVDADGAVKPRALELHVEAGDAERVVLSVDLTATWEGVEAPVPSGAFPILGASLDEVGAAGTVQRHRALSMSLAHDLLEVELDVACDLDDPPCTKDFRLTLERIETAPAGKVVVTIEPTVTASTAGTESPGLRVTEVE